MIEKLYRCKIILNCAYVPLKNLHDCNINFTKYKFSIEGNNTFFPFIDFPQFHKTYIIRSYIQRKKVDKK